jgi:hypothetical protein
VGIAKFPVSDNPVYQDLAYTLAMVPLALEPLRWTSSTALLSSLTFNPFPGLRSWTDVLEFLSVMAVCLAILVPFFLKACRERKMKTVFFGACKLLFGLFVFALSVAGVVLLYSPRSSHFMRDVLVGSIALCAAVTIMFVTVHRWAGFIVGFVFLPAFFRGFGAFLIGQDIGIPAQSPPRVYFGFLTLYAIATIMLLWRFVGRRPASMTLLDRLALIVFVLGFDLAIVQESVAHRRSVVGLIAGLTSLLIAWIGYRWHQRRRSTRHPLQPVPSA